jgi:hypothetical protein
VQGERVQLKIRFEDREWDFDEDEIDVRQATVLYLTYKMTLREWIEGVSQVDQRSLHFTYWLMLQQNGVIKPIADCNPKIIAFGVAYGDAREEQLAEEHGHAGRRCVPDKDGNCQLEQQAAEPGPTSPPSTSPGPASPEPSTPTAPARARRAQTEEATGY